MVRMKKLGRLIPKRASQIRHSRIGIGFEKLDRGVFDPEKAYELVAQAGVKWARLQSGWQRTEKQRGVYDFSWLDPIVDRFLSMKIEPWICLCYGNELYTEAAKKHYGAVGCPPIHSKEEKQAWARYVHATVTHFKGRVRFWEVWNEPDGEWCWKHGPDPLELAELTRITARACKKADPDCEVLGPALCYGKNEYSETLKKTDILEHLDGITYHAYCVAEGDWSDRFQYYKAWVEEKGLDLKIIQGESGTQSRYGFAGALRRANWTELKQAKFLLRHLITDLKNGCYFTSYFSCMDMVEALNGINGDKASRLDYGYFGVIGADFDENGYSVGSYTPKPSYYALQNLCSVLCDDYEAVPAFARGQRNANTSKNDSEGAI
ncbi:MAG: beta-galactosidase [Clostridia bacterium]|nr:beta-galactosidase [Clostridia bacterium]